ncbi:MAG: hypothetical protein MR779_02260 [Tenericutes bacterium]|nr:hypothetical protein [Mycoplasmatota bacterium]
MLKRIGYFIIGVICCFLLGVNIKADVKYTINDKRKAVVETAEAYFKKGNSYQYDNYRENKFSSPEEANNNNNVYAVCSSFINQIYYNTFKLTSIPYLSTNFIEYANKYYKSDKNQYSKKSNNEADGKYILKYYDSYDKLKNEFTNVEQVIKDWSNFLEPGDIIIVNYKFLSMGHTIMVYDVDKINHKVTIIENNGKVYDMDSYVDSYEKNGSIAKHDLYDFFKNLYIDSKSGNLIIKQLAIVRYITDDNKYLSTAGNELNLGMNTASVTRINYPKMNITKSSSVANKDGNKIGSMNVNLGDTITYTITIKNNSNVDYNNLTIEEHPDSVVTVKDNLNNYSNNKLSWKIAKIKAGQSYTIKYSVLVPNSSSLNGKVIHSTGKVGNIENTNIYHYVGKSLSKSDKTKLYEIYQSASNLSDLEYINYIYKQIGYDINLNNMDIKDIIEYKNDSSLLVKNTKIKESNASKMIFGNFYGLAIGANTDVNEQKIHAWLAWRNRKDDMTVQTENTKEVMANYANRAKTINKSILEVGDIIIVKKDGVQNSYIYIKDSLLVRKNQSGFFENYSNESLNVFLRNLVGKNYVILRPALGELKSTQKPEEEKKDNETSKDNESKDNGTNKGNETVKNDEKKNNETIKNDEKKDNETTRDNETKDNEVTDNNEKDDSETVDEKTNTTDNNPNKIQNSKTPINRKAFIYIISSFIVIVSLATFASHIFKIYKK